ncbi:UDP-N-acetylmuramate dehydrogenase [Candidatus Peregrinibacteria bacterium]|jgi:UDP-N-acetylmuramate dehydrogenase|nr:UDP-N-acetylmuramate dehydrogenase [Candidatus Peregrinibacteria bacterium]
MIQHNFPLLGLNTFNLDYKAKTFISCSSEEELKSILPVTDKTIVLGGGSNFLFCADVVGTVIQPTMGGISVDMAGTDKVIVAAGAGVVWDDLVRWCVENGYHGLESLSDIPGNVGASPVQNIGAYGAEAKDSICKVRAICLANGETREFNNEECHFGYRDSVFKKELKNKYLITKVFFLLSRSFKTDNKYDRLQDEIARFGEINPINIRKAVINIRGKKLPDPKILGNAGSFFKNPVVSSQIAATLLSVYPKMPVYYESDNNKKLSAAWLIDQCGWKGIRVGDAGVHDKQPLVLVNFGKASGMDILNLSEEIRNSVAEKFNVNLEREVEVVL